MSFTLTSTALALSKQNTITPQLILDIDGIPLIFGSAPILSLWRLDEGYFIDTGLRLDTAIEDINSRSYISLDKSTKNITQQVVPDKSGTSSVSSVTIELVDKNQELSSVFKFGNNVDDLLSRDATVYLTFAGAAHPVDSIPIFRGYVDDYVSSNGNFRLSVSHPENKKRATIFNQYQDALTSELRYKQVTIQNVSYQQRTIEDGQVSIEYIHTGSIGASYSYATKIITVNIDSGVSTASDVANILKNTQETLNVVEVSVVGSGDLLQAPQSLTDVVTDTTVNVTSTGSLLEATDILSSYIRIDDEYMLVSSFTDTTIEVIRGQFGSAQDTHEVEAEILSVYRLQSQPIDMLLKIYLSDGKGDFFGSEIVQAINQIDTNNNVDNAISFGENNLEDELGLIVGDTIKLEGSLEVLNDGEYTILEFNEIDGLFYIVVDATLITVTSEDTATCSFKSQYNILPDGLGLTPREIDVQGHLDIDNFNPNTFPILDFRLEDEIDAKEFCDKEIMFPVSLYSIPRKARISLKLVQPPLTLDDTVVLDETTVINMSQISVKRSVNRFLYNQIVYKYEKLIGEDRYLRGRVILNEDSANQIKAGKKQLTITSDGLRNAVDTDNLLTRQTLRLFDRYQFSAQQIDKVEVGFSVGFNVEIGDIVRFGGDNVQITDLSTGERIFKPRLMEVINKSLNFVNGNIKLSLLETAYGLEARYGVISLGSNTDLGSTNQEIKIKPSFGSADEYNTESDKWQPYVNQRIRIRSEDYDKDEIATLLQVKPSDQTILVLKEPLSFVPDENYIIEVPEYDDTGLLDGIYKDQFVFNVAQPKVTLAIDNISFEVDRPDDIPVGSKIYIHSDDYDEDSFTETVTVVDVSGSVVTLDIALSFVPLLDYKIEKASFIDDGFAYLLI